MGAKEEVKEAIVTLAAGGILIGGMTYFLLIPAQRESALRDSYHTCRKMLEKASGNQEITDFIYDKAIVDKTRYYKDKTCREIINEYRKGEQ